MKCEQIIVQSFTSQCERMKSFSTVVLFDFFAFLVGVSWYLTEAIVFIFIMIDQGEQLLIYFMLYEYLLLENTFPRFL